MQRLEVSGAVRPIYGSLGVQRLSYKNFTCSRNNPDSNKDVIFTPTTVLTDCAEIQQSAVNWIYVFDREFRDFLFDHLSCNYFCTFHVTQATIIHRKIDSRCIGKM